MPDQGASVLLSAASGGGSVDKGVKARLLRRYDEQVDTSDKTYRPSRESFKLLILHRCFFLTSVASVFRDTRPMHPAVPLNMQETSHDGKRVLRYT